MAANLNNYNPPLIISATYTHIYIAGQLSRVTKSAFLEHTYILEVKCEHGVFARQTIYIDLRHRNPPYKAGDYVCGYVTMNSTYSHKGGWNRFKPATIRQQHPELSEAVMSTLMRFSCKPNVNFPDLDPMTGRGQFNP